MKNKKEISRDILIKLTGEYWSDLYNSIFFNYYNTTDGANRIRKILENAGIKYKTKITIWRHTEFNIEIDDVYNYISKMREDKINSVLDE